MNNHHSALLERFSCTHLRLGLTGASEGAGMVGRLGFWCRQSSKRLSAVLSCGWNVLIPEAAPPHTPHAPQISALATHTREVRGLMSPCDARFGSTEATTNKLPNNKVQCNLSQTLSSTRGPTAPDAAPLHQPHPLPDIKPHRHHDRRF